jgi:hypothetical protein
MRITVAAPGTRGDVQPMIALGKGLPANRRGNRLPPSGVDWCGTGSSRAGAHRALHLTQNTDKTAQKCSKRKMAALAAPGSSH